MANPNRICSVVGCDKTRHGKGFCGSHYHRFKLHGDPLGGGTPNGEPLAWVSRHVSYKGSGCLFWPFGKTSRGYGNIAVGDKWMTVSRYMCELANGDPPTQEHEAAHSCGNRACANPNHLSWKSGASNQADRLEHGTDGRGEKNSAAKLSEADVREIRALKGIKTHVTIAREYGVAFQTISQIQRGNRWGWLEQ